MFLAISLNSLVDFPSPFDISINCFKSSLTLLSNLFATATSLSKNLNIGSLLLCSFPTNGFTRSGNTFNNLSALSCTVISQLA